MGQVGSAPLIIKCATKGSLVDDVILTLVIQKIKVLHGFNMKRLEPRFDHSTNDSSCYEASQLAITSVSS